MTVIPIKGFFNSFYSKPYLFCIAHIRQVRRMTQLEGSAEQVRLSPDVQASAKPNFREIVSTQKTLDYSFVCKSCFPYDSKAFQKAIEQCIRENTHDAIPQIFELARDRNIVFEVGFFEKIFRQLDSVKRGQVFDEWFIHRPHPSVTLNVSLINMMIKDHVHKGNFKQILDYIRVLIGTYDKAPNATTCTLMLSACVKAHDMESAEIVWDAIEHDPKIEKNVSLLNHMLRTKKMVDLLYRSQQLKPPVQIDINTCWIIQRILLHSNQYEELVDFCERLPMLCQQNKIEQYYRIASWRSNAHLKMLQKLDPNIHLEQFSFHQQRFTHIFQKELYPNAPGNRIQRNETLLLMEFYVVSNRSNWMDAVPDIERILFQDSNHIRSVNYWNTMSLGEHNVWLDLSAMSPIMDTFLLRYLMTFRRDELKEKFDNGPIKIAFESPNALKRIGKKPLKYNLKKGASAKNDLQKWKVHIRLEPDATYPFVFLLNQEDVAFFFQTVPPRTDFIFGRYLIIKISIRQKKNLNFELREILNYTCYDIVGFPAAERGAQTVIRKVFALLSNLKQKINDLNKRENKQQDSTSEREKTSRESE
ncbi:hypothetical protein RFI_12376 [Reticulomyxa filosa]|uniref:Uncharacterized protein n=1 Tax=Reticulomyxa filosa TaxID=46433 RepID=X6NEM1_RETFI|nr:hypothetical protein RFI_12376 [Reticulomyxa filosa]|eukprot:ETO24780.1 hypothetical protein RFI_12376 [Reticulomyxa filosa]